MAQVNAHFQVAKHLAVPWMSSQARACATRCLSARLRMLALQTMQMLPVATLGRLPQVVTVRIQTLMAQDAIPLQILRAS